ncbi:hypothetical protein CLM62_16100 [Streptomyces sp. SA15]|uniref:hypothetical protein n=1 Tax=Streptomyces sp. SA15 TaxID=934019 RepID=UPI000BAF9CB0|nr:hypothetical protein [Streptomyces sp. SA15]PAZ14983.1 hypothetical protein CLM62_16100 [Streptomyces sp. SA15]
MRVPDGRDARGSYDGDADLPEELRALGRSLDPPGAAGSESMVERVLEQILAMGPPPAPLRQRGRVPVPVPEPPGAAERLRTVRHWTRARWRSLTATLCGLLTVLALTPPVRASVLDWFDFGGVQVRYDPSATPSSGAEVPGCGRSLSMAQAERRAGFEPLMPRALGVPDAVTVTDEPQGRFLVSLCWHEQGRVIRLDEFAAGLDVTFAKAAREQPEWLELGADASDNGMADPALWFPRPHVLSFWLVGADGEQYTRKERTAGPTLLWTHDVSGEEMTLRLEGVASKARAVEIAKSLDEPDGPSSR